MLVRRRYDWFPVVATDMFCGLLGAVIILDAVSPRSEASPGKSETVLITYAHGVGVRCDSDSVVFALDDEDNVTHSTIGNHDAAASMEGGMCIVQASLDDIRPGSKRLHPRVIVAELFKAGDISVALPGEGSFTCPSSGDDCD